MSVLCVNGIQTRWRVRELENLTKHLGEVHSMDVGGTTPDGDFDYVFYRPNTELTDKVMVDWMLKHQSVMSNKKIINKPSSFPYVQMKDQAFQVWEKSGIPTPKNIVFENKNDILDSEIKYPFLIRLNNQVSGNASFLIHSVEELDEGLEKLEVLYIKEKARVSTTKKICVEFIDTKGDTPYNKSYRIIVAGDSVVAGYARLSSADDWIAITGGFKESMGETFIKYQKRCQNLCKSFEKEIVESIQSLGLILQGVDIIEDTDGNLYWLEVQPGFSCGYPGGVKPFYNPNQPELVNYIIHNQERFKQECPFYYYNWLNKETLFDNVFSNVRKKLNEENTIL